ncbi:hypothetical protein [Deinococcus ficus]|uniref:Uncharacterized protein n=1 Tax=Deinococcus ficus TaxID=317577 RepID=A0A221SYP4_9DEIO|nr:hypothetical protein [Deinococcus ficus]ASN81740.1 hypothetical protein DFI_12730 [Deinococcus ficus]
MAWLLGVMLLLSAAGLLLRSAWRERRPCEQPCIVPAVLAGLLWGVGEVLIWLMVALAQAAGEREVALWSSAQRARGEPADSLTPSPVAAELRDSPARAA